MCVLKETSHPKNSTNTPICSSSSLEIIGVDFLYLEKSSGGFKYILLITHHFNCYKQTYPTKTKIVKTAANYLYNDFILRFGISSKMLQSWT